MVRKLIAPIVIVALLLLYLIGFIVILFLVPELPLAVKLIGILIPLATAACAVAVLVSRIREIRSGAEDDLDHY